MVSTKVADPKFESQTKVKLANSEVEGAVVSIVNDQLGTFFEEMVPDLTELDFTFGELRALHTINPREAFTIRKRLIE